MNAEDKDVASSALTLIAFGAPKLSPRVAWRAVSSAMTKKCENSTAAHGRSHSADAALRRRALAPLLPIWPHELENLTLEGRRRVVVMLARALRAERCRGRAGHWAYDLARHAALYRIWNAERRELDAMTRAICTEAPLRNAAGD